MKGYKEPVESFLLIHTLEHPLTARTIATICEALSDKTIEQDWLVLAGEGCIRFELRDFKYESEVQK